MKRLVLIAGFIVAGFSLMKGAAAAESSQYNHFATRLFPSLRIPLLDQHALAKDVACTTPLFPYLGKLPQRLSHEVTLKAQISDGKLVNDSRIAMLFSISPLPLSIDVKTSGFDRWLDGLRDRGACVRKLCAIAAQITARMRSGKGIFSQQNKSFISSFVLAAFILASIDDCLSRPLSLRNHTDLMLLYVIYYHKQLLLPLAAPAIPKAAAPRRPRVATEALADLAAHLASTMDVRIKPLDRDALHLAAGTDGDSDSTETIDALLREATGSYGDEGDADSVGDRSHF